MAHIATGGKEIILVVTLYSPPPPPPHTHTPSRIPSHLWRFRCPFIFFITKVAQEVKQILPTKL